MRSKTAWASVGTGRVFIPGRDTPRASSPTSTHDGRACAHPGRVDEDPTGQVQTFEAGLNDRGVESLHHTDIRADSIPLYIARRHICNL